MWHLGLTSNNITFSLSRRAFSNEISVMPLTDNSEHETFYLISPHFSKLSESEYEKAYYKALSFVRLINGCLLLKGDSLLLADNYLTYFNDSYTAMRSENAPPGRSLVEYEQLVNPYEDLQISDRESKTYLDNCLTMVKNDEKVRRVIGLLYLYHRDNLYLLVNAYKIYEIILVDLGFPVKGKEKWFKKAKMNNDLPQEILPYLDCLNYLISGDFTHYANTITNSDGTDVTGILSRHGESDQFYNKTPLNLGELDMNIRNLVNGWLSVKIKDQLGVTYEEKYQSKSIIQPMSDYDYIFDF